MLVEIGLSKIKCKIKDSYGLDSDEPYVIVFAADNSTAPLIKAKTTLYGPWVGDDSMDGGDTRTYSGGTLAWGFDNKPRELADPDNAIILVGLLESDHDEEFCNAVRTTVHSFVLAAMLGYGTMDRRDLVDLLIQDMQGALDAARRLGIEHDERLGDVKELVVTQSTLDDVANGAVSKTLKFKDSNDDFSYEVTFQIGQGEGTTSDAITVAPYEPKLEVTGCAAVCDRTGHAVEVIFSPPGSTNGVRVYSADGGGHWTADWKSYYIGQGQFISGPAAAASDDGKRLHVFGTGLDNRIWRAYSADGGSHWSVAWSPIGQGIFISAPAAAVSADGMKLHVFGLGTDNRIWRAYSGNGGAHWDLAWSPIGEGTFQSAPAAAVSADGMQLHVFGLGMDNRIWRAYSPNGGGRWDVAWAAIGEGIFNSGPAAAVSGDGNQLHVFGRGTDNKCWRAYSSNGGAGWNLAWAPIGEGVFSSGPAAALSADGKVIHVFGRGLQPPPPPPNTFPDPDLPRVWRAASFDGGKSWAVAWAPIVPTFINVPVPS
jgi:hypothetical protein